jgi:hypothetical protein
MSRRSQRRKLLRDARWGRRSPCVVCHFAIWLRLCCFAALLFLTSTAEPQDISPEQRRESIRAFEVVAAVLQHPRCINCHVPDNHPRQGDDSHIHIMGVERGPDGRGAPYLHCTTCHQDRNSEMEHAPPGAPGWRMPGPSTPMAWLGLSVRDLCESVKDLKRNGNRSASDLLEHAAGDHLVNWGWRPGPGRPLPVVSHEEFVAAVRAWTEKGAACPEN